MILQFKRLPHNPDLALPTYATAGAAGFDLAACVLPTGVKLFQGCRQLIPTGFACAVPAGYELQLRPRSGLALRKGVTLANAPGTVDHDFRGEVMVCLINHGDEPLLIERGDRIAQAVLAPVVQAQMVEVLELDDTARGAGGFGSTGSA